MMAPDLSLLALVFPETIPGMSPPAPQSSSPVKNVFVLMLENHSFDNMLALSDIPGIDAATSTDSNSYPSRKTPGKINTCYFHGNAPASMLTDPGHEFLDVLQQLAGTGAQYPTLKPPPPPRYPPINNSGFAANYASSTREGFAPPHGKQKICEIMAGFDTAQELPAMYALAKNFTVCDHWFSSLPGPTWPNRFFLHGASSNGLDHSPSNGDIFDWETWDGFRYPHGSIFDQMTDQGITWRLYHDKDGPLEGAISQVSSIHNIELWNVHPVTAFEEAVQSASYPYQYTFIEPNYGDVAGGTYENGTSQHPMDGVAGGEKLIAKVYNAIRKSPIWKQSLFIITYDEHGGFYDHVPPPAAVAPRDGGTKYSQHGFDFKQAGVRVPAIIISPYVNAGVDQTPYDHSSVLATLEWLFGMGPLTNRDKSAASLKPLIGNILREDTPAKITARPAPPSIAPLSAAEKAARELELIPEGSTLTGMLGVLLKAHSKMEGSAVARARFAALQTRGDARAYIYDIMAKVEAVRAAGGL
jgi:phospholipase C